MPHCLTAIDPGSHRIHDPVRTQRTVIHFFGTVAASMMITERHPCVAS